MSKYVKAYPGPNNSVIYETDEGKRFMYSGGKPPWRNQNPGNLRPGDVTRRNGAIGTAGGFAVFPDYETGHKALLDSLMNKHGNKSLRRMIYIFSPPEDKNKTAAYLRFLRKQTGVKDDKKIKDFSKEEFEKLWKAVERMEGWKKESEGTITELPPKKPISGVRKNKKGTITAYFVEGIGWISKPKAIALARNGEIDAVVATSRSGRVFLRSRPDTTVLNNLDNLG